MGSKTSSRSWRFRRRNRRPDRFGIGLRKRKEWAELVSPHGWRLLPRWPTVASSESGPNSEFGSQQGLLAADLFVLPSTSSADAIVPWDGRLAGSTSSFAGAEKH